MRDPEPHGAGSVEPAHGVPFWRAHDGSQMGPSLWRPADLTRLCRHSQPCPNLLLPKGKVPVPLGHSALPAWFLPLPLSSHGFHPDLPSQALASPVWDRNSGVRVHPQPSCLLPTACQSVSRGLLVSRGERKLHKEAGKAIPRLKPEWASSWLLGPGTPGSCWPRTVAPSSVRPHGQEAEEQKR